MILTQIRVLFPLPFSGGGPGYTCRSLTMHMGGSGVEVKVYTPVVRSGYEHDVLNMLLPRVFKYVPYRFFARQTKRTVEDRFLREVGEQDIAYLWSEIGLDLSRALKQAGRAVVREKINCFKAEARRILDNAYDQLGWPNVNRLTDESIRKEQEELSLCDFVFSPSPMVRDTLLAGGVDNRKIIPTSYGWDPERFSGSCLHLPRAEGMTVLFVGSASVRKGVPWLLDAWRHARVRGRLVIAGSVAADVAERCADALNREDVVCLGHVRDIGSVYRSADVFAFPSLEEGGPQVTYEAMGCGLPVLVSPMGAGAAVRDGEDGFVRDPMNRDAWVDGLVELAQDHELREELGRKAKMHANEFTWQSVGSRRRDSLVRRFREKT